MRFILVLVLLVIFNTTQAYELQAECDLNNHKTCDLTIKEFVIGSIEFEDESLALSTYTNYCHQNIKKHFENSKASRFKIKESIDPEQFCFKYEKLYNVESKSKIKKPHLFYLDSSFTASFPNRAKYYRKDFKVVLKSDEKTYLPNPDDVLNGIKKIFSDCKAYTEHQLSLPGVLFSYCDDGYKGIANEVIGTKDEGVDFTPVSDLFEDALDLANIKYRRSKKPSKQYKSKNIWETSVRVKAYTIVSQKFKGVSNVEYVKLRPDNFFTNGYEYIEPKKKPTTKGTLQKISDAVDTYNKFSKFFGKLVE